jgi:hypothetical protein
VPVAAGAAFSGGGYALPGSHHAVAMEENSLVPEKFDLGDALEDPSHSEEWRDILRMVARYSVMRDETACRFQRVNKAFKFCWSLAEATVAIDRRFALKTPDVLLAIEIFRAREKRQRLWLYRDFHVTTVFTGDHTRERSDIVKEVHYDAGMGASFFDGE